MPGTVIENPILNSPYDVPARHWRITDEGITDEPVEGRRISAYFVPVPPPRRRAAGQMTLESAGLTAERMEDNVFINRVREHVDAFRASGYRGVTPVTRELLDQWTDSGRERRLFFCQIEAMEAAIFLTELAGHSQPWIENQLREDNDRYNPGLYRIAFKMATGAGKTTVMAMLIAWQALNKLANPQDRRFGDAFLVVTPGITIRDRLRVLYPNYPGNIYQERDLLTTDQLQQLGRAKILITNFHAFIRRDTFEAASLTKKVLAGRDGDPDQFKETPEAMVRRVARSLGSKKGIIVLNDEAHHCYQSAPQTDSDTESKQGKTERISADERAEAKANAEAARVWLNGLRAVKDKLGIRSVYDLSATPFFLSGSGFREGTLFPWVVSDFSLIDAIESGIVKIPRVPVADDSMTRTMPTYRDLWVRIRDDLPKKGLTADALGDRRELPKELEGALISLYGHYRQSFDAWHASSSGTPPVFIVVCQNTSISKLVFDWVAGWEKTAADGGTALVSGGLELFSNVDRDGWRDQPRTMLIDSAQLESGEGMDPAFKRMSAAQIEEFQREYVTLNPGRSIDDITDEDLLREAMNTIGKPGRLGEQIRCVVSVSMLTEGWDANTVTHILGVRAFKTQLLCEQVVGRGLRRVSYDAGEDGLLDPEYAEVFGVPFQFLPTAGISKGPTVQKQQFRVHALGDRADLEQTFPRLIGYRYELPRTTLTPKFDEDSVKVLSTQDVPTSTEVEAIVGEGTVTTLDELRAVRMQQVEFTLAKRTLDTYLRSDDEAAQPWLFPQVLRITKDWLRECVQTKDRTFPQLLLLTENAHDAAQRIYHSIVRGTAGEARVLPLLRPYEPIGSSQYVDFTTTKTVWPATKSHLNYLVQDSNWESKVGQVLEDMDEVVCYVKNDRLGLRIPYAFEGGAAHYLPDILIRVATPDGELNLLVEVTGERRKDKQVKVDTARTLWVPAVNNSGDFGRWSFYEITDPWNAENDLRAHIEALKVGNGGVTSAA
jgi:type III restriction enzyme